MVEDEKKNDIVVDTLEPRTRVARSDTAGVELPLPAIDPKEAAKINPDDRYRDLVEACAYLNDKDKKMLDKAYSLAKEKHNDQRRKSGEPYVVHPIEVALILADLHMDIDSLCAALLHDTVEDTDTSTTYLKDSFN